MRRSNFTAFNEFLPLGTTSTTPAYTSAELNNKLAHFDQLALQVIIDNVSGTSVGTFDLFVEHSADGRNFVALTTGATGDVHTATSLSTTSVNLAYGKIDGTTPLLGYVRFRMQFSNTTTAAHVHVLTTQRDQGG